MRESVDHFSQIRDIGCELDKPFLDVPVCQTGAIYQSGLVFRIIPIRARAFHKPKEFLMILTQKPAFGCLTWWNRAVQSVFHAKFTPVRSLKIVEGYNSLRGVLYELKEALLYEVSIYGIVVASPVQVEHTSLGFRSLQAIREIIIP